MLTTQKSRFAYATRVLACLLLLTGMLLVLACQEDEERLEAVPYLVLESVVRTEEITFDETLRATLDELGVTEEEIASYQQTVKMASLRSRVYKAHVITYHTTDPNGRPVVASGVVYYPKSGKPKGVIETLTFNKEKFACPSKKIANYDILQGMSGYIVIVADQIGCGATEPMVCPYMYHDNVAKVSADMRQAATELIRNVYGRSMPAWTLISGYSLGASEAWALARYYHFHPELGVRPSQIWVGGGVYNPLGVLKHLLQTHYTDYAFIPNALYSVNHYDSLGLDLHEVFCGELRTHYEEWCTGNMSVFDLTKRLGTDVSHYLNMDFFDDANDDYQRICSTISHMAIPNDWVPSCPVHIYHGSDDTYVPISISDELVDYLRSVGADCDYVVTEGGHPENCFAMTSDLMRFLYK